MRDSYDKACDFVTDYIDVDNLIELAKETRDRFDIDIKTVISEMIIPEIESLLGDVK